MNKILCVAVILLGVVALSNSRSAGAPTGSHSPVIIAAKRFQNQSAPIPTTTIFTPPSTGLFRLSAYATQTTVGTGGQSQWFYNFAWTDDSGPQTMNGLMVSFNKQGPFVFAFHPISSVPIDGPSLLFEATAGTPVTYSMSLNGPPDGSTYSLYYVIERME